MKYFLLILVILALIYGALWFSSKKTYQVEYGISFNQYHAESLGLDWKDVYLDMLEELKPKYIRIAAMWNEVEEKKDEQNFSNVDWMMDEAKKHNTKVVLVVGQKSPRWPECNMPQWLDETEEQTKGYLLNYVQSVVEGYRDNESLEFWQVENEPFIKFRFGECDYFNEEFVEDEIKLVRELDLSHKIIITDSGELSTWRKAINMTDYFGTTLYRVIRKSNGNIFTYDWLPPAVYRYKAKIWGQDLDKMFVSELQAEPWFTSGDPNDTPLEIQEQTMNPERLKKHLDYAERIGVPRAYLWGVEWWYWVKEARGDSRYWNIIKDKINNK